MDCSIFFLVFILSFDIFSILETFPVETFR